MRWCLGRHKIRARLSAQPRASSATRPPFASAAAGVLALQASTVRAGLLGLFGSASYVFAAALLPLYEPIIWLDSSSFTAGTARHRGAVAARCDARRSFHARLHRRLHGFSTSAVQWHPRREQRPFLSSHCFRSRPRRVYPYAAARALRRPWIGMTAKSRRFASGTRDSRRPLQRTARYVS